MCLKPCLAVNKTVCVGVSWSSPHTKRASNVIFLFGVLILLLSSHSERVEATGLVAWVCRRIERAFKIIRVDLKCSGHGPQPSPVNPPRQPPRPTPPITPVMPPPASIPSGPTTLDGSCGPYPKDFAGFNISFGQKNTVLVRNCVDDTSPIYAYCETDGYAGDLRTYCNGKGCLWNYTETELSNVAFIPPRGFVAFQCPKDSKYMWLYERDSFCPRNCTPDSPIALSNPVVPSKLYVNTSLNPQCNKANAKEVYCYRAGFPFCNGCSGVFVYDRS
jgi:hypothetical protein